MRDVAGAVARPRSSYRSTFGVLVVAVSAFSLIQSLVIPVMAGLAEHLGTDRATVTWVLTAYLLSASVFTPILGRLADAWGKSRMLVVCLLVLAVGCAISALAPGIGLMIAGRAVAGVGGAIMPISFGIIRDEFPRERVAMGISVISSLLAFGLGCGIVVAGPLVDLFGYSALFWAPCLVGLLAAVAAHLVVPESTVRSRERFGVGPALLLTGWLVAVVLGISQAPRWGWTSTPVLTLFTASAVLLCCWVAAELRADVPVVDIRLMRRRGVCTANAVALLVGFGLYSSSTLIPQLVQTSPAVSGFGLGVSVTESGLMMLPTAAVSFLVGFVAAPAAARVGGRVLVIGGCVAGALGMAMIAVFHVHPWQIYAGSAINGFGTGLVLACLANLVVAAVPAAKTGVATGMNANVRTIGGAIGSAVITGVLASHPGTGGTPAESGFTLGFLTIAAVGLAAGGVALAIPAARSTARLRRRSLVPQPHAGRPG